ncbi:MAG TPA: ABC transporter permease [Lachnospiraceae bacterium]|nr:ABC transporter permease [Lachnospiraceae bacterium]
MSAIYFKEMKNYFRTMTGYGFLGFFTLIMGYFFISQNIVVMNANYNETLSGALIMFLILIPILTMRSFSEESAQKTDQLLYCAPVNVSDIVIGKFLAAASLFLIGMLITGIFPAILYNLSEGRMDTGLTAVGCVGFVFLAFCFISVGIFISSLTDNQLVAGAGTFAVIFMLLMMDNIASSAPIGNTASLIFVSAIIILIAVYIHTSTKNIAVALLFAVTGTVIAGVLFLIRSNLYDGAISGILGWFSVLARFENFYLGSVNVSDVIYYITFCTLFIYLTVGTIEKRRWS